MRTEEFISKLRELALRNVEVARQKNADYAGADDPFKNFRACERHGISVGAGILVRMEDKMARIGNLLQKEPAVAGESLLDAALDLANYATILAVWWENERAKQANVVGGSHDRNVFGIFGGPSGTVVNFPPDGYNGNT